ncbi:fumarylacetoacetate hydrolase family protein [Gordonia sp. TBRC 11910]|uniref:Fumarylacetoacetate hydrolase family protein n=1 Tax=Gordonia asplenii TaxID=2725283 RepID=A0A848L6U9_9ACTN|nr:fumarylacetoacetate hydrolase family protein [Gordonia asplenii]NMO04423.1 fumarylacetoacetate hydrolase family protein [Gordonia asplenii]
MKLATIRTAAGTRAVSLDAASGSLVDLGVSDVGTLLAQPDWRAVVEQADGEKFDAAAVDFAPVVPAPSKVVCVGHNYRNHIREMGREMPSYPTLFTKFADCLIGANDTIEKPKETDALDWEVELTIVIGQTVRRADEESAAAAIAGFTVMNDISVRDWQFRTIEWTQGKIWGDSTPVGPYLVTPDELPGGVRPELAVSTVVDGQTMQSDNTADLLFDPVHLVQYISTILPLRPGDLIATGTSAGVGHARDPKIYLQPGQEVVASIDSLGECRNTVVEQACER